MAVNRSKTAISIPGFAPAREVIKKKRSRLVTAVAAQEKDGKTTFGLTGPAPLAFINLDEGLEGVVEKFIAEGKELFISDFRAYSDATSQKEWERVWEEVKRAYINALASPHVRTVTIDTETEMWELCRLARFGKLDQVKSHHYGPVNAEYRELIRKVYDTDKNLILLRKLKDEYVDDKRTGNKEMAGYKDIPYQVQCNAYLWRRTKAGKTANLRVINKGDGVFVVTVVDSRQNPALAGEEFEEPLVDFPHLASMVFPETDLEEWE